MANLLWGSRHWQVEGVSMIHGGSRLFLLRHFHPKKMLAKMNSNLNSMFRVRKSHQIGLKAPSLLIFTSPKKWEHLEFIGPFFQMLGEQSTKLHPWSPKTSGRKTWDFQPLLRRKTHLPSTSMFRFHVQVLLKVVHPFSSLGGLFWFWGILWSYTPRWWQLKYVLFSPLFVEDVQFD